MVRYGVMRHDCRRTDHNDLMCILFVYFRSGNMKMILQLGNNRIPCFLLFCSSTFHSIDSEA